MVTLKDLLPVQLIVGDPRHAVTAYSALLSRTLATPAHEHPFDRGVPLHVQFTDRIFGSSPEAAADAFAELARSAPVTVTLHDVPQPSDGAAFERRVECYRRVLTAARGVVCNSRFERSLVEAHVGIAAGIAVTVIPLPVDIEPIVDAPESAGQDARARADAQVAVLGFFYPGKGHSEVIEAVAALSDVHRVTILGRASAGHEAELQRLVTRAAQLGVSVETTGFLDHDHLIRRARAATVPVAAHRHFSASASINTWISAGRRPLVPDVPYTREMADLRPGTLALYDSELIAEAIEHAWNHPDSTWLGADALTGPGIVEVADLYRRWWSEVA